jgi:hypothetical protein
MAVDDEVHQFCSTRTTDREVIIAAQTEFGGQTGGGFGWGMKLSGFGASKMTVESEQTGGCRWGVAKGGVG